MVSLAPIDTDALTPFAVAAASKEPDPVGIIEKDLTCSKRCIVMCVCMYIYICICIVYVYIYILCIYNIMYVYYLRYIYIYI